MNSYKLIILIFIFFSSCNSEIGSDTIEIVQFDLLVDRFEVSASEFSSFVEATDYVTTADSLGWSGVFNTTKNEWEAVDNANWQIPDGVNERAGKYPVSQISYYDACAYCNWKNGRLPTADEWDEIAGDEVIPGNVWQGVFPVKDLGEDGYKTIVAPRGSFTPNKLGIHDLFGNVWEWTSTIDEDGQMIIKGGSFLCDKSFCSGYYPEKYQTTPKDSGLDHLGFRCVYDK